MIMISPRIVFLILFLLIFEITVFGQIEKPQYNIRTERADTLLGEFTIELFPLIAPLHCAYFDSLVNIEFYDSTAFHRVVPDFVIQGGDPNSKNKPRSTWGEGDSAQATIKAEFSGVSHFRGIIGAARDTDINSASSQFYINVADNTSLDWDYTAFGKVLTGMDIVDLIVNVPRDANDNPIEKIEMFIRKIGSTLSIPSVPTIFRPEYNAVGILELDTMMWEQIDDAVMYHVEISKSESFDSVFMDLQAGSSTFRLPAIELGNIKYYWRVKANNGGSVSDYSEVSVFYSSIEAPLLIYPEMNDDSITIQPTFTWHPVDGATGYRIQISRAPTFPPNYIIYDVDTITVPRYTPPPLEPKTSHYWRVYSLTSEYQGPVSEFRRFVTPDLTDSDDPNSIPENYSLKQNFPNPFNPSTVIKYTIPSLKTSNGIPQMVDLSVYNILGRKMATLFQGRQNPGEYEIIFKSDRYTSGIYYYKLTAGNYSDVKKMIILK
jgi:peptidyl-prolyl cis-trans isomerase B (cyclophilin B)